MTPRCNDQPGAKGLGQPRWTLTVQTSHHLGKPLWNPRISRPLRRGHTGCNPWTKGSAHGLMGSCYWLGQQSPSGQNTESSRGSYGTGSLTWYTGWHGSKGSLWLTPRTLRQRTSGRLTVTLLRALRPDVGGWVTLSPKYWAGKPLDTDGGRAPYAAVLDGDPSWSSKLACYL